ncbi:hypothetical protein NL676_020616 [Syzygium grande]|nr:hypothetical protein NL676_020616 [Syzygium grande]
MCFPNPLIKKSAPPDVDTWWSCAPLVGPPPTPACPTHLEPRAESCSPRPAPWVCAGDRIGPDQIDRT